MSEFGKRIKELRKERDLSQEQVAQMVGVSPAKISHIETGFNGISFPLAVRVAQALGVTVNDLVPDSDREPA